MKKRLTTARPFLLRNPSFRISPRLLSRLGEAVMIASPIVFVFFSFWLGMLALLSGITLVVNGYRLSEPERFAHKRALINRSSGLLLKRLSSLWRRNPPH